MGVMSLAVSRNTEITIQAEGSDAEKAVEVLAGLVQQDD
jgi:phosphotransferase system HPr (HPr) family protein